MLPVMKGSGLEKCHYEFEGRTMMFWLFEKCHNCRTDAFTALVALADIGKRKQPVAQNKRETKKSLDFMV